MKTKANLTQNMRDAFPTYVWLCDKTGPYLVSVACADKISTLEWGRGENIFQNWRPWVAIVLVEKAGTTCPGCFTPGCVPDTDIECEECGLVSYCSWGCRAKDELHQYECDILAGAGYLPQR